MPHQSIGGNETDMRSVRRFDNVKSEYRTIAAGGKRLELLIVRSTCIDKKKKPPCVLWLHGGGYLLGMPEMLYKSRAIDLVTRCGAVVVSPRYTLSVRGPYPQAVRECHHALLYILRHAEELGINKDQIIIGGESAGGGLAAALCMYALDHHSVNIAFQLPLYPMIDCYDTDSSRDNHERVWNTRRNHIAWRIYLRNLRGRKVPVYASPARRKDYSNLPPCYSFVGDIDPFHDETLTYIENLKKAGVPAEADVYEGFYHAYDRMQPHTPEAKHAADVFVQKFQEYCGKYTAKN